MIGMKCRRMGGTQLLSFFLPPFCLLPPPLLSSPSLLTQINMHINTGLHTHLHNDTYMTHTRMQWALDPSPMPYFRKLLGRYSVGPSLYWHNHWHMPCGHLKPHECIGRKYMVGCQVESFLQW